MPVLFLGEWCLTYPERVSEVGCDAKILKYHWDDRKRIFKDYKDLVRLYEVILESLSHKLNEIHKVDRSIRFWRILAGPWLGMFILFLYDRWCSILQALQDYDICESIVLTEAEGRSVPNDMNEFSSFFPGDVWNHDIYSRILKYSNTVPLIQVPITVTGVSRKESTHPATKPRLKDVLAASIAYAGDVLSGDEEAVFIATYLKKWEEFELAVRMGQFPRFLRSFQSPEFKFNRLSRNWVLDGGSKVESEFECFLRLVIPEQIPRAYLEGFQTLIRSSDRLPWPRHPKVIWTSNLMLGNDLFKVWAADKVEKGAPLLIGQHGGNYGMGLWNWQEEHELSIADRYLTWGWSRTGVTKLRPVGILNRSSPVKWRASNNSALLVTVMIQRYGNPTLSIYSASQWLEYLRDQFTFVDALPESIQSRLIVRLSQPDYGWRQVDRWRDRFPNIETDDGSSNISKLIRRSRLYISTYNATTYLESLSLNIPTVVYWNPKFMETNPTAKPFFDELQRVGIFHDSPESAALHVGQIWNDIESWWESSETRTVRDLFVRQYAYRPKDKITRIKSVIQEVVGQS